jgi:hypothetical protein
MAPDTKLPPASIYEFTLHFNDPELPARVCSVKATHDEPGVRCGSSVEITDSKDGTFVAKTGVIQSGTGSLMINPASHAIVGLLAEVGGVECKCVSLNRVLRWIQNNLATVAPHTVSISQEGIAEVDWREYALALRLDKLLGYNRTTNETINIPVPETYADGYAIISSKNFIFLTGVTSASSKNCYIFDGNEWTVSTTLWVH